MEVSRTASESRWHQPLRWGSANLHYLGLIALMAGVGALVATAIAQGFSKSTVDGFDFSDQSTKTLDTLSMSEASGLSGAGGVLLVDAGVFSASGAGLAIWRMRREKQKAGEREAATTSQLQGASQKTTNQLTRWELLTRLLVVLAALTIAAGATLLALTSGSRWFRSMPMRIDLRTFNTSMCATVKAVSWPLLIAGAGATVVGFGGHKLFAKKLRTLRGLA